MVGSEDSDGHYETGHGCVDLRRNKGGLALVVCLLADQSRTLRPLFRRSFGTGQGVDKLRLVAKSNARQGRLHRSGTDAQNLADVVGHRLEREDGVDAADGYAVGDLG